MTTAPRSLWSRVIPAALLVAVLDAAFAFALCLSRNPQCLPGRVFRGIAGGLLGPSAANGGPEIMVLGMALHLLIATIWTVIYLVLYLKLSWLRNLTATQGGRILAAVGFGVTVWLIMNRVVVPMSASKPTAFGTAMWWYILIGHPVVVGLPIVSLVRKQP